MNPVRHQDAPLRLTDVAAWNLARAVADARRSSERVLESRFAAFLRDEGVDEGLIRRTLDRLHAGDEPPRMRLGGLGIAAAAAILVATLLGGWMTVSRRSDSFEGPRIPREIHCPVRIDGVAPVAQGESAPPAFRVEI